jgi:Ice-binding-like
MKEIATRLISESKTRNQVRTCLSSPHAAWSPQSLLATLVSFLALQLQVFGPGIRTSTTHAGNAVANKAQNDTFTAFNAAAGVATGFDFTRRDIGERTLIKGIYHCSSSTFLTSTRTLDSDSNANGVFVF